MIQELTDDILLYHGSYCEVQIPELRKCAKYKDFGQGFYLTTAKAQAENFARISIGKAIANGIIDKKQKQGVVSTFRFKQAGELLVKIYKEADADWLHCIVGHRRKKYFHELIEELGEVDIVGGKVANDNTNATITTYMAGAYGEVGTKSADDICISLLLPERLEDQFCFRTDRALACITFMESEQIWL